MSDRFFQVVFGPIVVRIAAHQVLASTYRALEEWLSAGQCGPQEPPDVSFELLPRRSSAELEGKREILVGQASLGERRLSLWDGRAWEATTERALQHGRTNSWQYRPRDGLLLRTLGRLPSPIFRFLHVHGFSRAEVRASTFLYRHLIPAVQTRLLEHDATFVHASSVRAGNGQAMLLSGWGGSGKTSGSAALYLGDSDHWQFMSDDLAIVGADGSLHFCPLPLNVFPYTTSQFQPLHDRVVRPMNLADSLHWKLRTALLGNKGVARRVSAPSASDSNRRSSLAFAVHLQRSTNEKSLVERSDPALVARICRNILLHELRQSLTLRSTANAFATEVEPPLPGIDQLARGAENILRKALRGRATLLVTVPESLSVRELGRLLASVWRDLEES